MSASSRPLLLVLGPSGSGKTTIAAALAAKEGGLHIDFDQWPDDGVTLTGLRTEWDDFFLHRKPEGLCDEFARRVATGHYNSGVLSLPGCVVLDTGLIESARRCGLSTIVMYGSSTDCLNTFLRREAATNRGLSAELWMGANEFSHPWFGRPEFAAYRVEAFRAGCHREMDELLLEVISRRDGQQQT